MLQLSKQTEYALQCMMCLSEKPDEILRAGMISEEKSIPRPFLAKILQKLSKAGFVESTRGLNGGFRLARKPDDIYLIDIVELMEGAITISKCAIDKMKCDLSSDCALCSIWTELKEVIERSLRRFSFKYLVEQENRCLPLPA